MARLGLPRAIGTMSVLALTLACSDGEPALEEGGSGEGGSGEGDSADAGEEDTGDAPAPGDECVDTQLVVRAPADLPASLRGAGPSLEPLGCAVDGPVVFVEIQVADRVDLGVRARGHSYTPRLALMRPGCVPVDEDPTRVLACAEGLGAWLLDIGPDVRLIAAVSIAPDDPALELAAPESAQLDPLDFVLELEATPVLGEGQPCGPSSGRCEAGTVCMGPAPEEPEDIDRCRRPPADSCVAPGELTLAPPGEVAMLALVIEPDEAHSDAHEHMCTGWRRPERVEALTLPAGLDADARLELRASDPRVGLALRGPSCLVEDALACAPASEGEGPTTLIWGGGGELAALAEAGEAPLLFIELPRPDSAPEPIPTITVEIEIRNSSAPP